MKRALSGLTVVFACIGCASSSALVSAGPAVQDSARAEFVSPQGRIRIDLANLTIGIGTVTHPLENCSTAEFHCFKNEALGFHIVAPRSCLTSHQDPKTVGGFMFDMIALAEHGDDREGRYVSSVSDRFAYDYMITRGVFEILHDAAGQVRFGLRTPGGGDMGRTERETYTYRLPQDQAFLRCTR